MLKNKKGITLIALVVTIIVLLILAAVSISAVVGDNGIATKAKKSSEKTDVATDQEFLTLAVQEYSFKEYDSRGLESYDDLTSYILSQEWCKSAVYDETSKSIIVIMNNCEHEYVVYKDGKVESTTGISLNKKILNLELKEGTTVTAELTATLKDITGTINWTNSNENIATISSATGEVITVTAIAEGQTMITASCGEYKFECTVNVYNYIPIGSYVSYNVEYTDVSTGGIYNANNGWRYLGRDDKENWLLISTTTPVFLSYSPTSNAGYENNGWWANDDEVAERFGDTYSNSGYSGYPSRYAALGLEKNFEKIPYEQVESGSSASIRNILMGRFSNNNENGTIGSFFRDASISDSILNVRALNLADINKAINTITGSNKSLTTTTPSFKSLTDNALGLFDIYALTGKYYTYWVASPYISGSYNNDLASVQKGGLYYIQYGNGQIVGWAGYNALGVRPVIELSSEIVLYDKNEDGILEIY